MKVAIVGAPRTGKTELALALSARLRTLESSLGSALEVQDAPLLNDISPADLVLLCGLDLDLTTLDQSQIDQRIRADLQKASINFQVVYGSGLQRLENALFCLGRQDTLRARQLERPESPARWHGACENCGDGECEHRLFTDLVKNPN